MRGAAVELILNLQKACDFPYLGRDLRLRHSAGRRTQREGDVVEYVEMWVKRVLLEHEGDVARGRRLTADFASADDDLARVGLLQARDEAQRGGLAGSGWAEKDHELTIVNGQREILHRLGGSEALADGLDRDFSHRDLRRAALCGMPAPRSHRRSTSCWIGNSTPPARPGAHVPPTRRGPSRFHAPS